jgi:glycosyltransferase involved in cell wall biosynthesis
MSLSTSEQVMRIAYLINQYPAVSHSFIRREILALERQGFEVMRISLRRWDQELVDPQDTTEGQRTRYALQGGIFALIFALLRMVFSRPIRFTRALALACRMGFRAERPLPIHFAYLAEACRIEPWLRSAEVRHVHAHFGTNSAEVAMLVHELGGPTWSLTVHGPTEFEKPRFIGLAEKIRRSTFVVAVSSFGRSQLYRFVEHQQWPKIEIVHCGLEADFLATPERPASGAKRLVCVGRLCEQKGQLLLIEAASRLAEQGIDFELVLAGDGEMRGDIEAMIARRGLQKHVRITGWISTGQVRDEILAARALVLPSFAEGLPVVLMEAMALRRPVISTYVAGIPELVNSGEHGWLVPAGEVEALTEAIRACLDAPPELLARMGYAAHKRVLAQHDVDKEASKLAALFRGRSSTGLKVNDR